MIGLAAAVTFLTRVPLPVSAVPTAAMLPWFPIVGALIGLVAAVVYAAASLVLIPFLAAVLAMASTILLTGALHEDGLADAADAWGGATSREEAMRILRDPIHGTYGMLALILSIVVRVGALASLAPIAAVSVLPAVHATSRGLLVGLMSATPPARGDGLAATLSPGRLQTAAAITATAALGIGLLGARFIPAALGAAAVAWLVRWVAVRRIAGVTGDVLGAAEQIVEMTLLVVLAAFSPW